MKREKIRKAKGLALLLAGVMIAATGCTSDVSISESSSGISSGADESSIQVQRSTATVMSQKEFVSAFEKRGELVECEGSSGTVNYKVCDVDGQDTVYCYRDVTDESLTESLGLRTFTAEYEGARTVTEADLKDLGNTIDQEIMVMKETRLVQQGENFYVYQSRADYEETGAEYAYESVFVEQDGKIYEIDGMAKDITVTSFQSTMQEIVSYEAAVISGKEFRDIMSEYGDVEESDSDLFDYQLSTDDFGIVYGNDVISLDQIKLIGTDKFLSVIKGVIETDEFKLSGIDLEALGSNYYHYTATQLESDGIKLPCDLYFFVESGKINVIMGDDYGTDTEAYREALAEATGLAV